MVAVTAPGRRWDRLAALGIGVALVLWLAEALGQLAAYRFGVARSELDSSADTGVFGALGTAAFAAAVAAAWLVPVLVPRLRRAGLWCAALLSAVFALDTASPPHVLALAIPLAAGALILLWRLGSQEETARRLLRAGCAVLAVSFAGHALGAWLVTALDQGADSWAYQAKVVIKHGGELAGWTLVATGLVSLWRFRA